MRNFKNSSKFSKLKIRGAIGGLFGYSAGQNDTFPIIFGLCVLKHRIAGGVKGIMGAVVIFDHGLKFVIIFFIRPSRT
jgi:hypothetical protein